MSAPQQWIAEYIWLSGKNSYHDIRSKCKTMRGPTDIPLSEYPVWNFDGSSTEQAKGHDTEILIKPVAVYPHPFLTLPHSKVVLCECFFPDGTPTPDNTRYLARNIFDKALEKEPWFGIEQEYVLYRNGRPLNWPNPGFPAPQGPYYCGNGDLVWGRAIAEEHYQTCLQMGLLLSGMNAEVMPSQWEFQVGPCTGIQAGDHMTVARWVYLRLGEKHNIEVNFDAKPVQGDWNGSGAHTNFSTKEMRAPGGKKAILEAIERLRGTVLDTSSFTEQTTTCASPASTRRPSSTNSRSALAPATPPSASPTRPRRTTAVTSRTAAPPRRRTLTWFPRASSAPHATLRAHWMPRRSTRSAHG
jgi:glutamine synthetase